MERLGLEVLGGGQPILSVLVGDEEDTLNAGNFLFERGYYVQSVTFPAVPYHAGVLRIQVNANHRPDDRRTAPRPGRPRASSRCRAPGREGARGLKP